MFDVFSRIISFNASANYQVRVLLSEIKDFHVQTIHSQNGVIIASAPGNKKRYTFSTKNVEIIFKKNAWYINNKKMPYLQLYIRPVQGHLSFNERTYEGSFLLYADKDKRYIINELDIEAYIYSVLKSESWPGWPVEVNKVFAIASRSYVMAKILEAAKKKQIFHIKNSNIHQTYTGVHNTAHLKKAVEETKGIILTYKKQPITAMFDSCCGGVIPAHIENVVDFAKAPYLARNYACTFCKKFKIFSWKTEYTFQEITKILQGSGIPIKRLSDIQVTKRDKAGVVQEVIVRDGKNSYTITARECYSLFDAVKSFCFSIQKVNGKIIISGTGYGHHVGICQWGARAMIDFGWDFKRILQFYYPGTHFVRLNCNIK